MISITLIFGFIASSIGIANFLTGKRKLTDYTGEYNTEKEITRKTLTEGHKIKLKIRYFVKENKIYTVIGIIISSLFVINLIFNFIPYFKSQYQVFRYNFISELFLISLVVTPIFIGISTYVWLFYYIYIRIRYKEMKVEIIIKRILGYIVYGFATILIFFLLLRYGDYNGKFDFWLFPKDTGYVVILIFINLNIYI